MSNIPNDSKSWIREILLNDELSYLSSADLTFCNLIYSAINCVELLKMPIDFIKMVNLIKDVMREKIIIYRGI